MITVAADVARNGFNVTHDLGSVGEVMSDHEFTVSTKNIRIVIRLTAVHKEDKVVFFSSSFDPQLTLWLKLKTKICQLPFGICSFPTDRLPSLGCLPDVLI